MDMVCGHIEHQHDLLTTLEKEKVFPMYERIFRLTMEVYKANNIPITSFHFIHKAATYWIQINEEYAKIILNPDTQTSYGQ